MSSFLREVFCFISSRNRSKSDGHNVDVQEERDYEESPHRKKLSRTASEPSDYVRFLSWDTVSFVTSQVKSQIDKGLYWIVNYSGINLYFNVLL